MTKTKDIRREKIGHYLKHRREARKLTQGDVSKACGYRTSQFVSNWERGVALPAPDSLELLASILGIDFIDLVKRVYACRVKEVLAQRDEILNARRRAG